MSFFLRTGSFYSISYARWKTNPNRIYIFVLFGSPVTDKVHALNLGARQLSTLDKARVVHTIARLSKIPTASKYSGQMLYRIFTSYLRNQVKLCYRTYFHSSITRATLFNYGLNKKEDFTDADLRVYNPNMLQEAKRDFLVRMINMYTLRGLDVQSLQASLAKIGPTQPIATTQPTITPVTSETQEPGEETIEPEIEEPAPEDQNPPDDLGGMGYE